MREILLAVVVALVLPVRAAAQEPPDDGGSGLAEREQWNTDEAERHYAYGRAQHEAGRLGEAIDAYRDALDLYPLHYGARTNLASALISTGKPDLAIPHLLLLLERYPGDMLITYNLALAYALTERPQLALDLLEEIRRGETASVEALVLLGSLEESAGDQAAAEAAYREASVLDPTRYEPLYKLARLLDAQGRMEDAVGLYRQALDRLPQGMRGTGQAIVMRVRYLLDRPVAAQHPAGWRP